MKLINGILHYIFNTFMGDLFYIHYLFQSPEVKKNVHLNVLELYLFEFLVTQLYKKVQKVKSKMEIHYEVKQ